VFVFSGGNMGCAMGSGKQRPLLRILPGKMRHKMNDKQLFVRTSDISQYQTQNAFDFILNLNANYLAG
jgi:hypothetical protein